MNGLVYVTIAITFEMPLRSNNHPVLLSEETMFAFNKEIGEDVSLVFVR